MLSMAAAGWNQEERHDQLVVKQQLHTDFILTSRRGLLHAA